MILCFTCVNALPHCLMLTTGPYSLGIRKIMLYLSFTLLKYIVLQLKLANKLT